LAVAYGPVEWRVTFAPLDQLIGTILSQNTSDVNSHAAFEALRGRFGDWDAVRRARVGTIAKVIRKGGLAQQKAPRIKAILEEIKRRHGRLSLDFLCAMPTDEAIEYLSGFPGVGPKTVACVLLFACGKPVLPVDTHVHRVSRRLGLIGEKTSAEKAHRELAELVPDERVLEFHIQLIRHGRRMCSARNPDCSECVLLDGCPEGRRRVE
jgi:endonuclease-3